MSSTNIQHNPAGRQSRGCFVNLPDGRQTRTCKARATMDRIRETERMEFATQLASAREFWRKFQHLVESPDWPSHLRLPDPGDVEIADVELTHPGYGEALWREVIEA